MRTYFLILRELECFEYFFWHDGVPKPKEQMGYFAAQMYDAGKALMNALVHADENNIERICASTHPEAFRVGLFAYNNTPMPFDGNLMALMLLTPKNVSIMQLLEG